MKKVLIFVTYVEAEITNPPNATQGYAGFGAPTNMGTVINPINIQHNDSLLIFYYDNDLNQRNTLKKAADTLQDKFNQIQNAEVRVFIHINEGIQNAFENELQSHNLKQYCYFYHHSDSNVWGPLSEIKNACQACSLQNPEQFIRNFEILWELHSQKKIEKTFSLLKHRIAHLFLPLDIDLQGISEVEDAKKLEYLKEVLNEKKNNHYYRQKLADLWYIMTGRNNFEGKVNDCEIIKPQHDLKELLKENKAIINLIKESEKQDKVKDLWEILLNLCGIKYDSGSSQYSVINSPILGFMCLMDKKIEKDMIEKGDVEEILNYFSKLNDKKGWKVKGANPEIIKSFHDWFCALDNCLDKIRKGLKDE
jgi:hypothetical protein